MVARALSQEGVTQVSVGGVVLWVQGWGNCGRMWHRLPCLCDTKLCDAKQDTSLLWAFGLKEIGLDTLLSSFTIF